MKGQWSKVGFVNESHEAPLAIKQYRRQLYRFAMSYYGHRPSSQHRCENKGDQWPSWRSLSKFSRFANYVYGRTNIAQYGILPSVA
ncbi:hypothetical protein M514_07375, partial [Trichuris suis]